MRRRVSVHDGAAAQTLVIGPRLASLMNSDRVSVVGGGAVVTAAMTAGRNEGLRLYETKKKARS
jgi:hypothetical protein